MGLGARVGSGVEWLSGLGSRVRKRWQEGEALTQEEADVRPGPTGYEEVGVGSGVGIKPVNEESSAVQWVRMPFAGRVSIRS